MLTDTAEDPRDTFIIMDVLVRRRRGNKATAKASDVPTH